MIVMPWMESRDESRSASSVKLVDSASDDDDRDRDRDKDDPVSTYISMEIERCSQNGCPYLLESIDIHQIHRPVPFFFFKSIPADSFGELLVEKLSLE